MKVIVYVNWDKKEVISEKEYEDMIEKSAREYVESYDDFAEWLNDQYYANDIWKMSENDRNAIKEEYIEACHTWAEDEINDYWKPYEIEV